MTDPFARLGAAMVRWRWVVLVVWVVALGLAGALAAPKVSKEVRSGGIFAPDSESDQAAQLLAREFNASTQTNLVVVFRSSRLTVDDPEFKDQVTAGIGRIRSEIHRVRAASTFYDSGDPTLVSPDRRITFAVLALEGEEHEIQETVPEARHALEGLTIEHYVTGLPAVDHDGQIAAEEDLKRSEVFTIPIVLVLLLLVFRTVVAAAIPLILGAASVVLALAAIYGVALTTPTSTFAVNTASMIGLGLGIDFALIVINRFREERLAGRDTPDAVAVTMATAGRSITYSGITVLLAMLALTLLMFRLTVIRSIRTATATSSSATPARTTSPVARAPTTPTPTRATPSSAMSDRT